MLTLVVRAVGGVALTAVGFASMAVGSRGLPGSAIDMDSHFESDDRRPRFEPEPEATADPLAAESTEQPRRPTSTKPEAGPGEVACHWCHAVNDDEARYCDQCGMRF